MQDQTDLDQSRTDGEIQRDEEFDRMIHAIQSQLTGLIAVAANLATDPAVPPSLRNGSNEVLAHAKIIHTMVRTSARHHPAYNFSQVQLRDLAEESCQVYSAQARQRHIDLAIALRNEDSDPRKPTREPVVTGSAWHLQLMLNNLVHNAVKYSFDGTSDRKALVAITGHPAGERYCLCIFNEGYGILPLEITERRIFQDRYQGKLIGLHYTTGSGKGLFFADTVVQDHGGWIHVESEPLPGNHGTRPYKTKFEVYLPFHQKVKEG